MSATRYFDRRATDDDHWYEPLVGTRVEQVEIEEEIFEVARGGTAFWRSEDGTVLSDTVRYERALMPSTGELIIVPPEEAP